MKRLGKISWCPPLSYMQRANTSKWYYIVTSACRLYCILLRVLRKYSWRIRHVVLSMYVHYSNIHVHCDVNNVYKYFQQCTVRVLSHYVFYCACEMGSNWAVHRPPPPPPNAGRIFWLARWVWGGGAGLVGVNCHPLSSGPELGATHLHAMAVKLQLIFSLLVTESPDKCVSERER
jgi:hypothetical protein